MSSSTLRVRRHRQILELVRSRSIASQDVLAKSLEEYGYRVTQATLSRDLKELRVSRVPQDNGYRYLPAGEQEAAPTQLGALSLARIAAAEVLAVSANEVAVVLRTQAGRAQGVAAYLDGLRLPDVLATVAGDDTVLVIPTAIKKCPDLSRQLAGLFELPTDIGSSSSKDRKSKP